MCLSSSECLVRKTTDTDSFKGSSSNQYKGSFAAVDMKGDADAHSLLRCQLLGRVLGTQPGMVGLLVEAAIRRGILTALCCCLCRCCLIVALKVS